MVTVEVPIQPLLVSVAVTVVLPSARAVMDPALTLLTVTRASLEESQTA